MQGQAVTTIWINPAIFLCWSRPQSVQPLKKPPIAHFSCWLDFPNPFCCYSTLFSLVSPIHFVGFPNPFWLDTSENIASLFNVRLVASIPKIDKAWGTKTPQEAACLAASTSYLPMRRWKYGDFMGIHQSKSKFGFSQLVSFNYCHLDDLDGWFHRLHSPGMRRTGQSILRQSLFWGTLLHIFCWWLFPSFLIKPTFSVNFRYIYSFDNQTLRTSHCLVLHHVFLDHIHHFRTMMVIWQ